MLGLGNSLVGGTALGWTPADEGEACEGWWPKSGTFIINGSAVSQWNDESGRENHLVQNTEAHQPSGVVDGVVTFDGGTTNQHLDVKNQITLANDLTIGMVIRAAEVDNRALLGDNTTTNNWFRIHDEDTLHVKFDSSSVKGLALDLGTTFNGALYLVLVKDSSNELGIYINGVKQGNSISSGVDGQMLIDAIGIRHNLANEYGGTMSEIMIFSSESDALTQNVNTYLATI